MTGLNRHGSSQISRRCIYHHFGEIFLIQNSVKVIVADF